MTKKISPKGAFDKTFHKCIGKCGRWRGKPGNLYKRYKRAKRALQTSVIVNGAIKVVGNLKPYVKDWGKLVYQSKDK